LIESSSRFSSLIEHDLRANAFGVCREGEPLHTFPDHALASAFLRCVAVTSGGIVDFRSWVCGIGVPETSSGSDRLR
jgi:hypothetical protein